jgi:hypothetical protein
VHHETVRRLIDEHFQAGELAAADAPGADEWVSGNG